MENDPTGLMIIRLWVDPTSSEPVRVEIRVTADVTLGFERTLVLGADEIVPAVRDWLQDVLQRAEP